MPCDEPILVSDTKKTISPKEFHPENYFFF